MYIKIPYLGRIEMGGLRSKHRARLDLVRRHIRQGHRRCVDH